MTRIRRARVSDARAVLVRIPCVLLVLAAVASSGCRSPEPRLRYGALPLPAGDRVLEYAVYTPPDFHPAEALPVVLFLHGAGDGADCFDAAGVGEHLDAAASAGRIPRAVIVVPDGGLGFWENWADGSRLYRDWLLERLLPAIQRQYRTASCPDACHLVGVSMGGHGALRFLLFAPERFATVTAISAPIVDTEAALELANESMLRFVVPTARIWGPGTRESIQAEDPYLRWTRPDDLAGTRLMLAWGTRDHGRIVESNRRFDRHLEESGIPHEVLVFPGGHDWSAWTPALEEVLRIQVGGAAARTEAPAAHTKAPAAHTKAPAAHTK